jgi:pantetheine-phosphate adenylyltransferase
MKTALLTGSFDPVTYGHLDIFRRTAENFQKVIIGVGINPSKKYMFTEEERIFLIKHLLNRPDIEVFAMGNQLTADVAYELDACIVKGIRLGNADMDQERLLNDINQAHQRGLDTLILPCRPETSFISSSAAKEVCKLNASTELFVPLIIKEQMEMRLRQQLRIGLTGSIGTGKSTIAESLVEYASSTGLAVHNIDLDAIAHDILFSRSEPAYVRLRMELAKQLDVQEWSRKAVGDVVFNNKEARAILDQAMQTPLRTRIRAELTNKSGVILFNGALLLESGWAGLVNNRFIILTVPENTQRNRLRERGHSPEQAERRIQAQLNSEEKIEAAQKIIHHDKHGDFIEVDTTDHVDDCTAAIFDQIQKWHNEIKEFKQAHEH